LYTFMATSLKAMPDGKQAVSQALPVSFNWLLFGLALILLMVPIMDVIWQLVQKSIRGETDQSNKD